jgi:ribosomal protein L11 methyltransferase
MPGLRGARVLDLGSGTGILAIAALKLGAQLALCVDNDPAAVRTGELNCELNGVSGQVEHLCGTIDQLAADSYLKLDRERPCCSREFFTKTASMCADATSN